MAIKDKKMKPKILQQEKEARVFADLRFCKDVLNTGINYFKLLLSEEVVALDIEGIKNLVSLGQRNNIVIIVVLTNKNYKKLDNILKLVKSFGIKKVQLNLVRTFNEKLLPPLHEVANIISRARYRFYFDLLIKTQGVPYCLMPEPEMFFLANDENREFTTVKKCKNCRFNYICRGVPSEYIDFFDVSKTKFTEDVPDEVMLEVEARCNFDCKFCFNRTSFAKKSFSRKKDNTRVLTTEKIKKIIDEIKKADIKRVRFTGGEPMLRRDILDLIKYAKKQGLETKLNTNGSLIKDYQTAEEMAHYLDYVLFSMHTYDSKKDAEITVFNDSFEKKIQSIKWLKKAGLETIRVSTIGTRDNLLNLWKFYELLKGLRVDLWAVNRLIPVPGEKNSFSKKDALLLVEKVTEIKKDIFKNKVPLHLHIINALPLCAADPVLTNATALGGKSVDGHTRMAIDPRGFAKPIYYMEKNIGDPLDLLKSWNHLTMKKIRNFENVPDDCKKCPFLDKCKGGNKFCAHAAYGSYDAPDPVMDFKRVENYLW